MTPHFSPLVIVMIVIFMNIYIHFLYENENGCHISEVWEQERREKKMKELEKEMRTLEKQMKS